MTITFEKAKLSMHEIKELLTEALRTDIDPKEKIEKLASGLFPDEQLECQAIMKMMTQETEDMIKENPQIYLNDSYLDGCIAERWYEFQYNIDSSEAFIENQPLLADFSTYLMEKYKVNVTFGYFISDNKNYELSLKKKKPPTNKPKKSPIIDIELNEV